MYLSFRQDFDYFQQLPITTHLVSDSTSNARPVTALAPIESRSPLLTVPSTSLDPLVVVVVVVHVLVVVPVVEVLDRAPLPPLLQRGLAPGSVLFSTSWLLIVSPFLT